MQETWVQKGDLGQKDPLEKEMATHSSILAWKIPWMEEPGRLQSDTTEPLYYTSLPEGREGLHSWGGGGVWVYFNTYDPYIVQLGFLNIYLFLTVLGLCNCADFSLVVVSGRHSS